MKTKTEWTVSDVAHARYLGTLWFQDNPRPKMSGWAHVSGRKVEDVEVVGYHIADYFGPDGAYLGPDQDGIYPILA